MDPKFPWRVLFSGMDNPPAWSPPWGMDEFFLSEAMAGRGGSLKGYGVRNFAEATTGFEPVIRVLQTLALPLGHVAEGVPGFY